MIDGIKAFCRSQEAHDQLLLNNKQGLVFAGKVKTGDICEYQGEYAGLYVKVFEPTKERLEPGIYLHGSLHRYLKGSNDGLFTFKDLTNAIHRLENDFYIDTSKCVLQNLELGANIKEKYPEALINSAMLFHGKTGQRISTKNYFGKHWDFDQYEVKLYRKGAHTVRFELKIREMAKVRCRGINIHHLSDLCIYANYVKLLRFLYDSVNEFIFIPDDRENRLPKTVIADWNAYRADSYWEELKKDRKYRASLRVKQLVQEYHLIKWDTYLRHGVIIQGALFLKTSPWIVAAIFSALGLQDETVAGPQGNRDRQAAEIIMKTIPAKRYLMVRNIRYPIGVIISTLSYYPLLARGPPSRLSLSLL